MKEKKYTDGLESINRVRLLIQYSLDKTLSENIEELSLLNEQYYVAPKFPYTTSNNNPPKVPAELQNIVTKQGLNVIQGPRPETSKNNWETDKKEYESKNPDMVWDPNAYDTTRPSLDKNGKTIYPKGNWVESKNVWDNWDHDTSGNVELGLTAVGLLLAATGVGAPLGLVLVGVGTAVGVADAIKYYQEKDPYMGTMMLALQLIPGGELVSILSKNSAKFAKLYPKFVKILDKVSKNKVITDVEGKIFELGSKLFKENLPAIAKIIRRNSFNALKLKLRKEKSSIVLRTVINFLHFGLQKAPSWIGKIIIKIGRISVTIDQLWTLMSTPDSWRSKMRNKGEFSKTLDMLYDGTLTDSIKEGLWVVWETILGNDVDEQTNDDIINIIENMSSEADEHFDSSEIPTSENVLPNRWEKINKPNNQINKPNNQIKPVTLDDVIKGTRTVKLGQKGNVVTEIQNMLVSIGYYLGDNGKNKDGVDGGFGELTETAVKYFQRENNIEETGIVDTNTAIKLKETAIKLKEKYNER